MYATGKGIIKGIFNPEFRLTSYNYQNEDIEVMEILTKSGR